MSVLPKQFKLPAKNKKLKIFRPKAYNYGAVITPTIGFNRLPVVLISATRDIERSALAAGADDFLAKPFEIDDLLNKIKRHFAN